jgi:hypothetical protein
VASIDAWATWPVVLHMRHFQVVVAQVMPLTQQAPVGAVLVQVD